MKSKNCFSFFAVTGIFFQINIVYFASCRIFVSENFIYEEAVFLNGRRYRISTKKLNYTKASEECKRDGSRLAVINSSEISQKIFEGLERSALRGASNSNNNLVDEGVWIGLKLDRNRRTIRGRWSDGTVYDAAVSRYNNWALNEPKDQFCVQLWKAHCWKWDDTYCDLSRNFICEDEDPRAFAQTQVDKLTNDILMLTNYDEPTADTVNQLSLDANRLLDVPNLGSLLTNRNANSILLAIENITSSFNATWENATVTRRNIAIDLLGQISGNKNLVLGHSAGKFEFEENASILLTKSLLNEAKRRAGNQDIEISSILYRKPSFFVSAPNTNQEAMFGDNSERTINQTVLGNVISVDVKNVPMNDLNSPVIINHILNLSNNSEFDAYFNRSCLNVDSCKSQQIEKLESSYIVRKSSFQCVHWDFSLKPNTGDWSVKGCQLYSFNINNGIANISCRCNHMTNFAVILNTSEFYEPIYLTGLTITSCLIAIVCLLVTLITHLLFKQLRKKPLQQILIHICIGLLILNIFFLLGIDRTNQKTFCYATATILHYSVLLSWNWMLLEGVYLFRTFALYKSGSGPGTRFSLLATTLCYVLPGISVAICAGVLRDSYQSQRYCWISGHVLTYAIVIPVGIVLLINFGIFAIVMWNIAFKSRRFRKKWNLKNVSQSLRRAFYLTVVLGLPWVFGYLMLLSKNNEAKNVFSIIFTISNAIQAAGIVFLFCLRQENVRNSWTTSTRRRYRKTVVRLRGSTKKTMKSNQNKETKSFQTYAPTYAKKSTSDNSTTTPQATESLVPKYVRTPWLKQDY